ASDRSEQFANAALSRLFDRAFAPLASAVATSRIPGGVFGIVDRDQHRIIQAIGSAQLIPNIRPMRVDTWFDLASLTKVIFTTPRILALAEAGIIDLDAPLNSA
ncbi:beta-lactamase family protein, partial [Enterobacter hormaechei]|nr:beta-lactamase family protein [Enterobacter hormaechei]